MWVFGTSLQFGDNWTVNWVQGIVPDRIEYRGRYLLLESKPRSLILGMFLFLKLATKDSSSSCCKA